MVDCGLYDLVVRVYTSRAQDLGFAHGDNILHKVIYIKNPVHPRVRMGLDARWRGKPATNWISREVETICFMLLKPGGGFIKGLRLRLRT